MRYPQFSFLTTGRMKLYSNRYRNALILKRCKLAFFAFLLPIACFSLVSSRPPTLLEKIQTQGFLPVISRNGPTTYYEGPHGLTGFEYSLAKEFAKELGVDLVINEQSNLGVLIDSVGTPEGLIATSGLTITDMRKSKVRFSRGYLDVTQQLLYRHGSEQPKSINDLESDANILVIANSAQSERLRELKNEFPNLRWRERNDLEMIDLIAKVHSGEIDYAIVNSNAFEINKSTYPYAKVAFDVSSGRELAWAFPKQSDSSLYDAAQDFLTRMEADGGLQKIRDRYYGNVAQVDFGGALLFADRIESRLPKWEAFLQTAGKENNIDWRLLAAISYQESHWNWKAKSKTGVRGLMMLTQATAKDLGIKNRIDPEQSISGGARYFRSIFDRIPDGVQGADRTWMALAAYNIGMGHLEDARILTEKHGGDPDKWIDVKNHLPLLAQRKYFEKTKHGYARGWEPVAYVQNIRQFYNILSWQHSTKERRFASNNSDAEFRAVSSPDKEKKNNSLSL
ncbi:membrane-bound lytic murein transglycosylase MltF [Aurantivibrio infirmus]